MFNLIRNLFKKTKFEIASSDFKPEVDNTKTLMQMNETIESLQKRLRYIERVTWIEEPYSKNQTLDERFENKISRFSKKEQDLLNVWIDKEILVHNEKEIRLKDLPWNNPYSDMEVKEQNRWKTLRFLYLFWALDKLFKFRKDNFTVIAGGLKNGN